MKNLTKGKLCNYQIPNIAACEFWPVLKTDREKEAKNHDFAQIY